MEFKHIQGDYESCKLLHNFIGKKVISTQKLNAHHCKEQFKIFFLIHMLKPSGNYMSQLSFQSVTLYFVYGFYMVLTIYNKYSLKQH
jgi:hypothetical protein